MFFKCFCLFPVPLPVPSLACVAGGIVSVRDLSLCSGAVIQKREWGRGYFYFHFNFLSRRSWRLLRQISLDYYTKKPTATQAIPSLEMTLETRKPSRKERLERTNNARKKHSIANSEDGGCHSENNPVMQNTNSEIEAIYCFKICSNSTRRGASYGWKISRS